MKSQRTVFDEIGEKLRLERIATEIRDMSMDNISKTKSGHPGGSLSISDILTCLYFGRIYNSRRGRWPATPATGGTAQLRILLRFHGAPLALQPGAGPQRAAPLELALAEAALEPYGGRISYESLAGDEQVLRVDLPAAAAEK